MGKFLGRRQYPVKTESELCTSLFCFVLQVKKFLEVEVKPKLKPYEDKLESTVQLELWNWMLLMNLHNVIIDLHDNPFLSA